MTPWLSHSSYIVIRYIKEEEWTESVSIIVWPRSNIAVQLSSLNFEQVIIVHLKAPFFGFEPHPSDIKTMCLYCSLFEFSLCSRRYNSFGVTPPLHSCQTYKSIVFLLSSKTVKLWIYSFCL